MPAKNSKAASFEAAADAAAKLIVQSREATSQTAALAGAIGDVSGSPFDAAAASASALVKALHEASNAARDAQRAIVDMSKVKFAAEKGSEKQPEAIKNVAKAAEKAAPKIVKVDKAVVDTNKSLGKTGGEAKAASGALKSMGGVGMTAALGIAGGLIGVVEGLIKIGKTVVARDNLRATLDQVTRGRGAEALAHLDKLAKGLNMSVADAADQFVALRKAGAKAATATALIKLRADLEAVGLNAQEAQAQVDKALLAIRAGGDPSAVIAKTAKKFGAVGDGSNAAAKKAFTLEGIMTSLLLAFEQTAAVIADQLGPVMVDLARAFTEGFGGAEGGTGVLKAVKDAMVALIPVAKLLGKAVGASVRAIGPTLDALSVAWAAVKGAVLDATQAIVTAWNSVSPSIVAAGAVIMPFLSAVGAAFAAVGAAIGSAMSMAANIVIDTIGTIVSSFDRVLQGTGTVSEAFANITTAIGDAATGIVEAVSNLVSSVVTALGDLGASDAAKNFIDSLAQAIKDGASTVVAAASELASGVADAAKSALGIASPSKVAIAIGENFGTSMSDAIEGSSPPDLEYAMPDSEVDMKFGPGKGGSSSSTPPISITIQVAGTSATAAEIAAAVERAVESTLRRLN